jgi:hypothetical protein
MQRQVMILESQRAEMLANWRKGQAASESDEEGGYDPRPVVKLFNPCGAATWLLTELVEHEPDVAFGLCDLGHGSPELGYVSLAELAEVKLMGGALYIERDEHFTADKTLAEYARIARETGRVTA